VEEVRAALRPDEAVVLFGFYRGRLGALVIEPDGLRGAPLVAAGEAETLLKGIEVSEDRAPATDAIAAARGAIWERLALRAETRRAFVSPHGPLATVPFALLEPDREVILVPSASALVRTRASRPPGGEGILALGAPDYSAHSVPLAALPESEGEARAVGTEVWLGAEASETALRSRVSSRPRWRAVHLACHGLLDLERPALSALALSPTPEDDGLLRGGEVLGWRVPADLVVLSACDSGRGRAWRTEGATGLMRAFLMAGAQRVLCTLWKVDDRASRALVEAFYARWNAGASVARALRGAQEEVRSRPGWEHPFYWAGWALWGDA
jgi:CHAT domain-containing protein